MVPLSTDPILTEGAVVERLRRDPGCTLDPLLAHGAFPRQPGAARVLESVCREYLEIGRAAGLPVLLCTPTWRATPERLAQAGLPLSTIADGVAFTRRIAADYGLALVGGLMGCRGDCYLPEQALPEEEAARFHAAQARELAAAGCDLLFGATLPALSEAAGMARAMAATGAPYLISFVVNARGELLDGAPLAEAVARIDRTARPAPAAYLANCVHTSVMSAALERCAPSARARIAGLQANTSPKSPAELDGSAQLHTEEPARFAAGMMELRRRFGLRILGGCCGTDGSHIRALAARLSAEERA